MINFQYPIWFLAFCIFAGLAAALILYYKDKTFTEKAAKINWPLGILRFLMTTLLAFLLLSPFLKSIIRETKKPIVVLAQDNSESIKATFTAADSASYSDQFIALSETLGENYDLKQYSFGSEVREGIDFSYSDKESNIAEVLNEVYELYSNQNLGAVILATDGIYNVGSNPLYAGAKINVPLYTIALGDTTLKRDISIKKVYHNKIAYLGDKFSIQVDIGAVNCNGSNTSLNVFKIEDDGRRKITQENIKIDNDDFFTTKEIILDANVSGIQRYRIAVNRVKDEESGANNVKDIFIDVLDARQKILLLGSSPHPDLSALKQSIVKNKNYQADISYASNIKYAVANYDLVILHQLPAQKYPISGLLRELQTKRIPHFFILGSQSNLTAFGQAQSLLTINGDGRNTNDVQAIPSTNFNLFTVSEKVIAEIPKFAPLVSPFGDYISAPEADVLLTQKIGSVQTDYPLLVFGEDRGVKQAVLAGEGLWKWRIFDFLQHQNHDLFEEVLSKSIQYLTIKEDKRKFRVSIANNIYKENEPIFFDAELYNESYELINDPEASLVITNSEGKDFRYTFTKTGNAYTLSVGTFPVGNYRFSAKTVHSGKELTFAGKFSVQPIQLEVFETTANHQMLKILSEQYGGKLVYPDQLASISEDIINSGDVKPVFYTTSKTRSIINLKWIFFLLLGFLSIEWFIRKYFGGY